MDLGSNQLPASTARPGRRILNAMSVFARAVDEKIGWHRIGVALSIGVFAIACWTLLRLLRDIDFGKVVAAIKAMPAEAIVAAGLFVAIGYVTLTFYDFFALRTIGRPEIPYRIAALASFASYTIGHNLGATVFTGGAVRLRIYSAWGLGLVEVAKIAFVTGLTFWLGNIFVLGTALAYAPDAASAITQIPAWANRALGLVGLAAIVGYLLWLLPQRRTIGRGGLQIMLPDARLTLVQIAIGVLDLGCGAMAFYILLPAEPAIDLVTVVTVFVLATLLGFISHTPGSFGVFDVAVLIALPQYQTELLLASLLIFRLLYYMLPFALAVLAFGLREAWLGTRGGVSR
jgi:glycosyltransferase 2 family protein